MKYLRDFTEHFNGRKTFSTRDAKIFLKEKGIGQSYFHHFIHYLLKKQVIHKLAKGVYSFSRDLDSVGFAFSPFYHGLQDALSLHDLWEQETIPVIITTKKVRPGIRKIMGGNVLVRRIDKKMFFGFEMTNHYGQWIPVSGIEKTLIDFVYFKEKIPEETIEEIKKKVSKKALEQLLKKCPKRVQKKAKELMEK